MLKCKNCGYPYKENQIFCDHCGNPLPPIDKIEEEPEKKWIQCPTCKRKIIETTSICPFCGENINLDSMIEKTIDKNRKKSFALAGFIIGIFSFAFIPHFPFLAIILGVLGLSFSIAGKKENNKNAILGIITSIFSILIVILLLILVYGFQFSYPIFSWSIKEPPTIDDSNAITNNYKEKSKVYTNWVQENGEDLLVLTKEGTYEWYQDKKNIEDNYIKGVFMLQNGINTYNDITYEDMHFYYYQLTLINLQTVVNGENLQSIEKTQTIYNLGLSKKFNGICIENIETGVKNCFKKATTDPSIG